MRIQALFAIPLVAILGFLSLLHAYWALGGRWGSAYTVPVVRGQRAFNPSASATWVVCGLLAIAVVLVIGRAVSTGPLTRVFSAGVWGLSLVFMLRAIGNWSTFGLFKTVTGTLFSQWDTWLYSPLCLLLSLLAALLVLVH